jgi:ketosteroid isomerase-like protein
MSTTESRHREEEAEEDVPAGLAPEESRAYRDARLLGLCREGALEAARSVRCRESTERFDENANPRRQTMSSNREIVQKWFDLIAKGDPQGAFALFSPDVSYVLKGTTPVSGTYKGLKSIVEDFFTPWRKQIVGDLVLTVDELIADGERVVALARGKGKTIHNVPYDNDYAFVFRVKDGKITEVLEYLDTVLVETAAYGKRLVG